MAKKKSGRLKTRNGSSGGRRSRLPQDHEALGMMVDAVEEFRDSLVTCLKDGNVRARRGGISAFDHLSDLTQAVITETCDPHDDSVSGETQQITNRHCRLALRCTNTKHLRKCCKNLLDAIARWKPAPRHRGERPPVVLPPDETIKVWNRIEQSERDDPEYQAELRSIADIHSAFDALSIFLTDWRRSIEGKILGIPTNRSNSPDLRSWTQSDLDQAILEYKSSRAHRFDELVELVKNGRPGAEKSAQELFGRNAIGDALGVRSRTMVSKSTVWHQIADDLQLSRKRVGTQARNQKIGFELAVEEASNQRSEPIVDVVARNEVLELIRGSLSPNDIEATLEKFERGDITKEEIKEMIGILKNDHDH